MITSRWAVKTFAVILAALVLIITGLAICGLAFAQTRLSWDQAARLPVTWSRGNWGQYVARDQVRVPAVTGGVAATRDRLIVSGGGLTCQIRPIRSDRPRIIEVVWSQGALATIASVWDSGVWYRTDQVVQVVGDCVPLDDRGRIAGWILFATVGMPEPSAPILARAIDGVPAMYSVHPGPILRVSTR